MFLSFLFDFFIADAADQKVLHVHTVISAFNFDLIDILEKYLLTHLHIISRVSVVVDRLILITFPENDACTLQITCPDLSV